MSYQPNDFVNPHLRGVELPAGCKDLNELLPTMRAQNQVEQPIFPLRRGDLKDVPRYVQRVYMESYGMSLVVMLRAAEGILCIHNRSGGCTLTFPIRNQDTMLAPVVQDLLFGNVRLHEGVREKMKMVTAPLPHLWLEAAQIVERVIRGYGAAENAALLFYFVHGLGGFRIRFTYAPLSSCCSCSDDDLARTCPDRAQPPRT